MNAQGDVATKFVSLLLSEAAGRIVACNLTNCRRAKVLCEADISELLHVALRRFELDPPASCVELIGLLETEWEPYQLRGTQAELTGGESGKGVLFHLTRYTRFLSLLNKGVRSDSGIVSPNPYAVAGGLDEVEALHRLAQGDKEVFAEEAMLGYGALWVTPDAMELLDAEDSRNLLGLVHIGAQVPLVKVAIPAGAVIAVHRPTIATAGGHRRFKQCPDAPTPPGVGMTVDLLKHCTLGLHEVVDGATEVVAKPQKCADLAISWHSVGPTMSDVESRPRVARNGRKLEHDVVFVNRLRGKRSLERIRLEVESLCRDAHV